jgi:glycosyltransferase involved in cell wall biosynthesis
MINQTYQNFEMIIVIEYGCTDETRAICESFALDYPCIHLYENEENLGIARSLNKGIRHCNGKYIARMDADDISYPFRLERQVAFMEANPKVGLLGASIRMIQGEVYNVLSYPSTSEIIKAFLLFYTTFAHPCVMFRSELFYDKQNVYPNIVAAEDYALFGELIDQTEFANQDMVLLDYFCHEEQHTYLEQEKVMASSIEISRNLFLSKLGLDTSPYPDEHFGILGRSKIKDWKTFLDEDAHLLRRIERENRKLHAFDEGALQIAVKNHWNIAKNVILQDLLSLNYE